YIPSSRRQLNINSNISNYSTTNKSKYNCSNKSSRLSNILRRISRENDEQKSSINLIRSTNPTQQIFGSVESCSTMNNNSNDISKRSIPLYNNNNIDRSSLSSSSSSSTTTTAAAAAAAKGSIYDLSNSNLSKSNNIKYDFIENSSNDKSNTIYTYEPVSNLYQIEPIILLGLMRTRLDAHRNEFNNRPKCVPSTRSPLCTHHCVIILAARLLTILSQNHNFQLKFIENKQNLSIIIDMLNINNDPVNIYTIYI
ncbi:unnamed protein product, partial [Rotaria sp. Silwood2]